MNEVMNRINRLRREMKEHKIDYYIIPTADYHQSEYVSDYFKAREYITGFTGSAGTALISCDKAFLWTDGRYFIQAEQQLQNTDIILMKSGEAGVQSISDFLLEHLKPGQTLGFDGKVISFNEGFQYEEIAKENNANILDKYDLVDFVWDNRPKLPQSPVFELDFSYTGESRVDKINRVRNAMIEANAQTHILTSLDDICWMLNIRGGDVAFSPLVLSYLVLSEDSLYLYTEKSKFDAELQMALEKDGVVFCPYDQIYLDCQKYGLQNILCDSSKMNYSLVRCFDEQINLIDAENPTSLMKALKNDTEIEHLRIAHLKDSVAHVRFMKWLKESYRTKEIFELDAVDQLDLYRKEMGGFIQPSFEPISAYGSHAAMCHYSSTKETNVKLEGGELYLTDTGSGFWDGSTDITRTYALGNVSEEKRNHFTLVVMANLRLADAKFIKGTTGANLDILARQPFWERGLDFKHGTGHGVGYLLNIHEGPANICWLNRKSCQVPLEHGMVLTDEPGIYIENSHGIRLENELLVCKDKKTEFGDFLCFEILTYIPFDLDAIVPSMMTAEDVKRLNHYHKQVYEKLECYLNEDEKEWLKKYTREI